MNVRILELWRLDKRQARDCLHLFAGAQDEQECANTRLAWLECMHSVKRDHSHTQVRGVA